VSTLDKVTNKSKDTYGPATSVAISQNTTALQFFSPTAFAIVISYCPSQLSFEVPRNRQPD
jgi:hypothetical protein